MCTPYQHPPSWTLRRCWWPVTLGHTHWHTCRVSPTPPLVSVCERSTTVLLLRSVVSSSGKCHKGLSAGAYIGALHPILRLQHLGEVVTNCDTLLVGHLQTAVSLRAYLEFLAPHGPRILGGAGGVVSVRQTDTQAASHSVCSPTYQVPTGAAGVGALFGKVFVHLHRQTRLGYS